MNRILFNPKDLPKLIGLVALYVLLAKLVVLLFAGNNVVGFLWLASGVGLAVALLGGNKYLPAVFLGALLGYLLIGKPPTFALVAALRHTASIFLAIWLLKREGRFNPCLHKLGDFLRILALAMGFGLLTALSMQALEWLGGASLSAGAHSFHQRWMGHALGIVIVMPLVLVWRRIPDDWLEPKRMAEAMLLLGLMFLANQIVFLEWFHDPDSIFEQVARGYWMFLIITLVAIRLRTHGVVLALFMTAAQALAGSMQGIGFFAHDIAKTGLATFWFYTMTLSLVGMVLATYFTERKQLEQQLSRRLRHRDIMERITQISLSSKSVEELLGRVLDEMLTVFDADRAWFLYPCDPDAISWQVPMERTRPEWPGAFARGMVIPMTPEIAEVFREVLASTKPLPYGPAASRFIPAAVAEQFSIRSQIQMALRPKVGSPWTMGLHHCAQARAYGEDELLIFNDIGQRVADALSSMIILKNLHESEERLRAITDNASTVIFLKDLAGRYLHVNRRYEELFHVTNAAILGKTDHDIFPEDMADAFIKNDQIVTQSGQTLEVEEQVPHDDGTHTYISVKFPLRNTSGEIYAVCGIATDITERKEYEEELKRSNIELEQFSYAVSHDMRQPLRMISSYLQLLEMGLADQLDDEKRGYFDIAIDGAKRIDQMLVALLEYSRVGRMGEPPTWIDSRTLLDEALQFLQPALDETQARLNITGDWPHIFVCHDEIQRLLQNLIGNAAKFRIAGRTPEITVSSEMVKNEWHLCVSDNGVGIIPDQIKRLFQVFQRLQLRTAYEGDGVGLALCRKIAEHHKGRIWAESAGEGRGSRFCVVLRGGGDIDPDSP